MDELTTKLEYFEGASKYALALDLLKHTDANFPRCITRINRRKSNLRVAPQGDSARAIGWTR